MSDQVFRVQSRALNPTLFEVSSRGLQDFENGHGWSKLIPPLPNSDCRSGVLPALWVAACGCVGPAISFPGESHVTGEGHPFGPFPRPRPQTASSLTR